MIKIIAPCLFIFIICETLARLILWGDPGGQIVERLSPSSQWRIAWVNRQGEKGAGLETGVEDIFDLTKGWALTPNLRELSVSDNKILNSNSKGIRGTVEYSYDKSGDRLRILALGDSNTFGEDVSDNETHPYYLESLLPSTEVINFGIRGYGHDQMLLYLKEEGIKYRPDIVLLAFIADDVHRNMLTFREYSKPRFLLKDGGLKIINSPVAPLASLLL